MAKKRHRPRPARRSRWEERAGPIRSTPMRATVGGCRRTYASLVAACMAIAMLAVAAPADAADCPFADAQPGEASLADLSQATVCLLNNERAAAGLAPLRVSAPL